MTSLVTENTFDTCVRSLASTMTEVNDENSTFTWDGSLVERDENRMFVAYYGVDYVEPMADVPFSARHVVVSDNVTDIPDMCFARCTPLVSIKISRSVKQIGYYAFFGCSGLKAMEIPNSVSTIGDKAFHSCTELTTVDIPNSVSAIGNGAFSRCTGLKALDIPNSVSMIGDFAFQDCTGLTTLDIPNSVSTIGLCTFSRCTGLTTLEIPASVTRIGRNAFEDCTGLTTLDIPNSVSTIGDGAFSGCTGLTTLEIPSSVTKIGRNAFGDCSSLKFVRITVGELECLQRHTLRRCTSLTNVVICNSKDETECFHFDLWHEKDPVSGDYIYQDEISALETAKGLRAIDADVFSECTSLVSVVLPATCTRFDHDLDNTPMLSSVEVVAGPVSPIPQSVYGRFRRLPLHRLCYGDDVSLDRIEKCLIANKSSADAVDSWGMAALHILACNQRASTDMIKVLQDAFPGACTMCSSVKKMTPLHLACCTPNLGLNVIEVLEEGLRSKNADDEIPLQLALRYERDEDMLLFLFSREPLLRSDLKGAKEKQKLDHIIELYLDSLKESPPRLLCKDTQHGFVKFVLDPPDKDTRAGLAEFLRKCDMEVLKTLAYARDLNNRAAIDVAVEDIRVVMEKRLLFLGRYELFEGPPIHRSATSVVMKAIDRRREETYKKHFEKSLDGGSMGETLLRRAMEELGFCVSFDGWTALFNKWDLDGTSVIAEEEFVKLRVHELDGDRPGEVVFKFMSDESQFHREIRHRGRPSQELSQEYVIGIEEHFDCAKDQEFKKCLEQKKIKIGANLDRSLLDCGRRFAVVMPFADRNLDSIIRSELRDDLSWVRAYAKDIGEALRHMHERGVYHGDVKAMNCGRHKGRLKLLDLDASVAKEGGHFGSKFSSGAVPPWMIAKLDEKGYNEFRSYFQGNGVEESHPLWKKVKPLVQGSDCAYVVKTFISRREERVSFSKTVTEEHASKIGRLPYELEKADNASFDIWSFGVLLYFLCTRKPLLDVDLDDDLKDLDAIRELKEWDKLKLERKLKGVQDDAAKDLLRNLLSVDRPLKTMEEVLGHSFFEDSPGNATDKVIEEMRAARQEVRVIGDKVVAGVQSVRSDIQFVKTDLQVVKAGVQSLDDVLRLLKVETQREFKETRRVILQGIFEATEVETPTTFVILSEPLEDDKEWVGVEDVLKESGEGIALGKLRLDNNRVLYEKAEEKYRWAIKWVQKGLDAAKRVIEQHRSRVDLWERIKNSLGDLVTKTMYFYLVDELTGEPVRGDGYPIEIPTTDSQLVPKLLPLMLNSMRAMSLYNGGAGIARMFGLPVPGVPEAWRKRGQGFVELLKQGSSVSKFGSVQAALEAAQGEGDEATDSGGRPMPASLRGAALRELADFLNKERPGDYAGLNRWHDEKEGVALWTLCTTAEEMRTQLELRAEEAARERSRQMTHLEGVTGMEEKLDEKTTNLENTERQKEEAVREVVRQKDEVVREKDAELQAIQRELEAYRNKSRCCAIL